MLWSSNAFRSPPSDCCGSLRKLRYTLQLQSATFRLPTSFSDWHNGSSYHIIAAAQPTTYAAIATANPSLLFHFVPRLAGEIYLVGSAVSLCCQSQEHRCAVSSPCHQKHMPAQSSQCNFIFIKCLYCNHCFALQLFRLRLHHFGCFAAFHGFWRRSSAALRPLSVCCKACQFTKPAL